MPTGPISAVAAHEAAAPGHLQPRTAEDLAMPTKIDRYEIRRVIGRGGMGIVYGAFDPAMQRDVAIKAIQADAFTGSEDLERFRREALAIAKLRHRSIVNVFDIGEHEGTPYIVMDRIEGETLLQRLKRGRMQPEALAHVGAQLASALHHAHEQGVIHRDVKPQNIIIDGEGIPNLLDFGLARDAASDGHLTAAGTTVGTPAYMAPEQADRTRGAIAPPTDVWALGAVLYAALTLHEPFQSGDAVSTMMRILTEEPPSPRKFTPGIPAELEAIVLRCLRKKPQDRFATADALAQALGAFCRGEPVPEVAAPAATPPSRRGSSQRVRAGGSSSRHRRHSSSTRRAPVSRGAARPGSSQRVEAAPPPFPTGPVVILGLVFLLSVVAGAKLLGSFEEGDVGSPPVDGEPATASAGPDAATGSIPTGATGEAGATAPLAATLEIVQPTEAIVVTAAERLVVRGRVVLTGGGETERAGARVRSGEEDEAPIGSDGAFVLEVALPAADGSAVVEVGAWAGGAQLGVAAAIQVEVDRSAPTISIEGGSTELVVPLPNWRLKGRVVDEHPAELLLDGEEEVGIAADGSFGIDVVVPEDGTPLERVLTARDQAGNASSAVTVELVCDPIKPTLEVDEPVDGLVTRAEKVVVRGRASDERLVAVNLGDAPLELAEDGAFVGEHALLTEGEHRLSIEAIDEAGNSASITRRVRIDRTAPKATFDPPPPEVVHGKQARRLTITGWVDEPGVTVTINGKPAKVDPGDPERSTFEATVRLQIRRTMKIEVVATDAAGNEAPPVVAEVLWTGKDAPSEATDEHRAEIDAHRGAARAVALSPDGTRLATGGTDAVVNVFDLGAETLFAQLPASLVGAPVRSLAWSPDGSSLLIGTQGGDAIVWLPGQTNPDHRFQTPSGRAVLGVDWLPGRRRVTVAAASDDGTVRFWGLDGRGGGAAWRMLGKDGDAGVEDVAINPVTREAATATSDGDVVLWDVREQRELERVTEHRDNADGLEARVRRLEWSEDGRFLASAGEDHAINVWRVAQRERPKHLARLGGSKAGFGPVQDIAIAPSGRHLVSVHAGEPGQVILWSFPTVEEGGGPPTSRGIGTHPSTVWSVDWSRDGKVIVTGGEDGEVRIWKSPID